ncbi:hypothetical protein CDD82_1661 [Ophiocordyceps australis]|uniref:FAD-binding domain-containing protein n=1 Tax=Ophiocordyceps australis TaxID=1399860 RepID=A0A2C5YF94_9HYPO|nr:hypothetical protein CDD82_1661 [Ophiocordyceps australis]
MHANTDFLAAGGPNGYAWNLIRSESDELLLKHAETSGAKVFQTTKVEAIQFETTLPLDSHATVSSTDRPISASWACRDGTAGNISFEYLIDASGRHGILSTKYLKNRTVNDNFKNIANWGYWSGCEMYGQGTHMDSAPYFEALQGIHFFPVQASIASPMVTDSRHN